jgi:uncharacterized protein (TIGR02145 family)
MSRNIIVQSSSSFSCGQVLTDIRDNKTYSTVQVGSQCWMATNLDYGIMIPYSQSQRDNCIVEKYCFNNNQSNCPIKGGYYQWDELMRYEDSQGIQGLCPPEWHIPSESEWNVLFNFFMGKGLAGNPIKFSGYSGFNALLTGTLHMNSSWDYTGFATFFWTTTSHGLYKSWAHGMNNIDPSVSTYPSLRSNAFVIRCVHN